MSVSTPSRSATGEGGNDAANSLQSRGGIEQSRDSSESSKSEFEQQENICATITPSARNANRPDSSSNTPFRGYGFPGNRINLRQSPRFQNPIGVRSVDVPRRSSNPAVFEDRKTFPDVTTADDVPRSVDAGGTGESPGVCVRRGFRRDGRGVTNVQVLLKLTQTYSCGDSFIWIILTHDHKVMTSRPPVNTDWIVTVFFSRFNLLRVIPLLLLWDTSIAFLW